MQQEFIIISVETDINQKKIIVTANNDIDPNSIDEIHVEVFERITKTQLVFDKAIKGNVLEVTLKDWPVPNSIYLFVLKDLKNILGESLRSGIKRKLEFKSVITEQVRITSPSMFEKVKEIEVKFERFDNTEIEEVEELRTYVYLEMSSDVAFHNIVSTSKIYDKDSVILKSQINDQYYIRARVESCEEVFQYGKWSEVVSFIFGKESCSPEQDDDIIVPPDFDDMTPEIDDVIEFDVELLHQNGITPTDILLEFTKQLDKDFAFSGKVVIIRKEVR